MAALGPNSNDGQTHWGIYQVRLTSHVPFLWFISEEFIIRDYGEFPIVEIPRMIVGV
jgi:hypothetical protein